MGLAANSIYELSPQLHSCRRGGGPQRGTLHLARNAAHLRNHVMGNQCQRVDLPSVRNA